jgi:branched-chain amino acid transport system ATP-binding protein
MRLLELDNVVAAYGKVAALHGLSFHIDEGEIVTLLGANGAGKSTTLRVISGLLKPRSGTVRFLGQIISGHRPESIFRLGVAHVPERRRIFPGLTVWENFLLGGVSRPGTTRAELNAEAERMFEIFPDLRGFRHALGWTLSGGQQQMVAIARGLMSRTKILLLDEPSLGLGPLIVEQVYNVIANIRRNGTTVLLVEQNANMALSVADRGYVLETGHLVTQGPPSELWDNEDVRAAYLGGRAQQA